jgi:hypothetical protein
MYNTHMEKADRFVRLTSTTRKSLKKLAVKFDTDYEGVILILLQALRSVSVRSKK